MNRVYRLVWNDRTASFVAAAESSRGRGPRSSRARKRASAAVVALMNGWALAAGPVPTALPTGGQIAAGQANISQSGSAMQIQQASQNLVVNWQGFDIGSAASVRFAQPNAQAAVLNRVLSAAPTQIMGQLTANGRVFVVNPSGVVFGTTARVDTAGLVASSLQLSDEDFLRRKYAFTSAAGASAGAVVNYGEIVAREGGFVSLVAPKVENAGLISATSGGVALAAGRPVRLDITDSGLIGVQVDGGDATVQANNSGRILADGGRVWMTARQAAPLLSAAINQTGTVRADTLRQQGGQIWLDGGGGAVNVAGSTQARGLGSGQVGGEVVFTGGRVAVAGVVDVSGTSGGGSALVGGGWRGQDTRIAEAGSVALESTGAVIADATERGVGGTVVLWSGQSTRSDGRISATGAAGGAGGRVETSSRGTLGVTGQVQLGAGGVWLLDPTTINVVSSGATGDNINASTLEGTLNSGGNVTLEATQDININADIAKTSGSTSTLTFKAGNNITLGSAGVSRKISASNDAAAPTVTSALNVVFQGTDAVATPTNTGQISIYGEISTNGGNVAFYKPTLLSNAKPVSTRVLSPNPTNPAASTTPDSGNVTFHKAVTLAGTSSVTIDTQAVQDSGQTYLRKGGNIEFKESVTSLDPNSPRSLILNTTGAVSIQPGFPGSVGGGNANYSGGVTFGGNVGTISNPLESLTIVGPSNVYLNAAEINLRRQAGDTMTFAAPGGYTPALVLGKANTTIRVTGFDAGSADYKQSTFNIVAGNTLSGNASLTIASDRSIQIIGTADAPRVITGLKPDGSTVPLSVQLSPSQKAGANSGSISLQNALIRTYGGSVGLASLAQRAYGVASEQNTDGIRIQASTIDTRFGGINDGLTNDGQIAIYGHATTSNTVGGPAINLYGATSLLTDTGNIDIDGRVASTSGGANKDAVLIGNRGQATVSLEATSGRIRILGDASAVGSNATVGASYNGVEISDAAMVRTVSGGIEITGKGGGGNNNNVGENVGVRLKDTDTQIVSQTGNITLTGQTGGKTTSYGIVATGTDMALGQERATDTAKTVVGARAMTGNIDLVADTMDVANNSSSRLRVMTARSGTDRNTGQINIRPLHDVAIQLGGTRPNPPSSDNVSVPDKPLFLDSTWFSGSNAVFQPGAGEVNIGRYGSNGVGVSGGVNESTKTLTVAGATTVRDRMNLLMRGVGGQVRIDAPLTVAGAGGAARTLNIEAHSGVTGTTASSLISVDQLRIQGGGDVVLSGPNLVSTVAIANTGDAATGQTAGNVQFNNAQALTVGAVTVTTLGDEKTTTGVATENRFASVSTAAGNLTIANDVNAGTSVVALKSSAGQVLESGTAKVVAGKLSVTATDDVSLHNPNQVGVLAAAVGGTGKALTFVGANGIVVDSVADGTGATTTGLTVTGKAFLQANAGSVTQTARITTAGLGVSATGDIDLSLPISNGIGSGVGNSVGVFAARSTAGEVKLRSNSGFSVGDVSVADLAASPTTRSLSGVETVTSQKDIALVATNGNLTLDRDVKAGSSASAYTDRGAVRLQADSGAVTQTAANVPIIRARQLAVAALNSSSLANANQVNELAVSLTGANQSFKFMSAQSVKVTEVQGVNDQSASTLVGTVSGARVPGELSLAATSGDITQSRDITAGGLLTVAQTGSVLLDRTSNSIGTFAARLSGSGASLQVNDKDGLTVGTVATVDGVETNNGQVMLAASSDGASTAGDLVLAQRVSAGTANIGLSSLKGAVTQAASGQVIASGLSVRALKSSALDNAANNVSTLAASVGDAAASFKYTDADALTVGSVNGVQGVSTNGGDISIRLTGAGAADSLSLNRAVSTGSVGAGTLNLQVSGGGITSASGQGVTAARVALTAARDVQLDGVNDIGTVAAQTSNGLLTLSHSGASVMTVGQVGTLSGVSAAKAVRLDSATGLEIQQSIQSGGPLGLTSNAGAIRQASTSTLTAPALWLQAAQGAELRSTGNRVDTLAAQSSTGGVAYRDAGSVTIGSVSVAPGTWGATQTQTLTLDGVAAQGAVWVRTGADLTLSSPVRSQASGAQALVLAATRSFTNRAGSAAVAAPNGRWLIYDDNPMLVDRLNGLAYAFRRLQTFYDNYPPSSVREVGNGYITTARLLDPDQAVRQVGGTTPLVNSNNSTVSRAIGAPDSAMGLGGRAVAQAGGLPLSQATRGPAAFVAQRDAQGPTVPSLPLEVAVSAGRPFAIALDDFLQGARVLSAQLASGQPLPDWLNIDLATGRVQGRMPVSQAAAVEVALRLQAPGLMDAVQILRLQLTPKKPDQLAAR